jgi:hypothetical protein
VLTYSHPHVPFQIYSEVISIHRREGPLFECREPWLFSAEPLCTFVSCSIFFHLLSPHVLPHLFSPAVPRASSRLLALPFTCDLPDPLSPTATFCEHLTQSPLSLPSLPPPPSIVILRPTAAQLLPYRHTCSSRQQPASEVLASLFTCLTLLHYCSFLLTRLPLVSNVTVSSSSPSVPATPLISCCGGKVPLLVSLRALLYNFDRHQVPSS